MDRSNYYRCNLIFTSKLNSWVLKESIVVFMLKITGGFIAFILQVYIARLLGPEQLGIYSYVFSWVIIFSLFSSFGFEHLQVRYIAYYKAKKQINKLLSLIRSGQLFVFSLGILVALLITIIVYILGEDVSKSVSATFLWGVLIIPILAIINSNNGILRGLKKQLLVSVLFEVLRPLLLLLFVVILVQYISEISAKMIMALTVGSLSLICFLSMYWIITNRNNIAANQKETKQRTIKKEVLSSLKWAKAAVPFILFVGVVQIEKNIDILMLGSLINMEASGIYTVATKITTIILLLTMTMNTVAAPIFSELYAIGKLYELRRLVSLLAKISSAISFVILLVIYFYGEEIICLFGREFREGVVVFKILTVAHFIKILAGPVLMISIMTGYQKVALKVIATGALIHVMLNAILIPYWGMMGAAVSASISNIFWCTLLSYLLCKKLGFNLTAFSNSKYPL